MKRRTVGSTSRIRRVMPSTTPKRRITTRTPSASAASASRSHAWQTVARKSHAGPGGLFSSKIAVSLTP